MCKLCLLIPVYFEKVFRDIQNNQQCDGATGLLLIYPRHCVHVIEVIEDSIFPEPLTVHELMIPGIQRTFTQPINFTIFLFRVPWNYCLICVVTCQSNRKEILNNQRYSLYRTTYPFITIIF